MRAAAVLVLCVVYATVYVLGFQATGRGRLGKFGRGVEKSDALRVRLPRGEVKGDGAAGRLHSSTALLMSSTDNPFYNGMDAYQILEIQRGADA